ncbi:hypothetical protein GOP47_0002044 [Adiantum capillus-veneris]|uniref:Uncharacterized protein n=1 Tax=Adiantum capillus-veneris TaxID=13818 RepID=A0A9D4ZQM6_ADICA|nr:hypothetical protein GOP47_0002044 [Adiantum capillus-veneris]
MLLILISSTPLPWYPPCDMLIVQLEKIDLLHLVEMLLLVFAYSINMEAITQLHGNIFQDITSYIETYLMKFTKKYEGEEECWLFDNEKNFHLKSLRIIKELGDKVDDDTIIDIAIGEIGHKYMVLPMSVLESIDKAKGKSKVKAKDTFKHGT